MARYLVQLSYTPEAMAALVAQPQDRQAAIKPALDALSGSMEQAYFTIGEFNLVCVMHFSKEVSAAALAYAIQAGGTVEKLIMTPLLEMQEGLEALRQAATCGYQPLAAARRAHS